MRSAAWRFHCSRAGSRAARRGPEPVDGPTAAGGGAEATAAAGAEVAGAGAAVGAGGEEPHPAASTITAEAVAIRRCCRFSIVQYLASSPTVHDRPGAGSKNRPLPSLTMIEPT